MHCTVQVQVHTYTQHQGILTASVTHSQVQSEPHFAEVNGMHHTQRHSAKVPQVMIEARSGIQQSITDQALISGRIVLMRMCQSQRQTL